MTSNKASLAPVKNLAYDESSYENMVIAGRKVLEENPSPRTVKEYCDIMKEHLNPEIYQFMMEHENFLTEMINNSRMAKHDYFSVQTFRNLISKRNLNFFEGPRLIYLRVAVQLHYPSLEKISKVYQDYLLGYYSASTPTLINAGFKKAMMSSCFVDMIEDSRDAIFSELLAVNSVVGCNASQGIDLSHIRHSEMSNGIQTDGVIPVAKLINETVRYTKNQRKGNSTLFLDVWHIDIEDFVQLNSPIGDQQLRAYDVHPAIWTYNLFWKRVAEKADWSLFCPKHVPGLLNSYGKEFEEIYCQAENDPQIPKRTVKALWLLEQINMSILRSGKPFILNRDAATLKSNHRHLGRIGSNLCVEIFQHLDKDHFPTCNLHSMSLRKYCKRFPIRNEYDLKNFFNFNLLGAKVRQCVDNLNNMMAKNYFPLDKYQDGKMIEKGIYRRTNEKYRAIAIGVSGFADALMKMDLTFLHPLTKVFNKMVFACIYFNALLQSVNQSITDGPCEVFEGSPTSQGLLQFDLWKEELMLKGSNTIRDESDDVEIDPESWGQTPFELSNGEIIQPSWSSLKEYIKKYGLYNSLVTALMPTNNSAQTCRNAEMIEPIHSNLYSRRTLSGNFTLINRHMIKDLKELGLWNDETVNYLRNFKGSLQGFDYYLSENPHLFPEFNSNTERLQYLLEKYLTMTEISQKLLLELSADRGRYLDQGESHNATLPQSKFESMTSYQLYAANLGLKVHNYYFNVTGDEQLKLAISSSKKISKPKVVCTEEVCTMCSS